MYCDSDIILYNSICMFTHQETKECTFCVCHVVGKKFGSKHVLNKKNIRLYNDLFKI